LHGPNPAPHVFRFLKHWKELRSKVGLTEGGGMVCLQANLFHDWLAQKRPDTQQIFLCEGALFGRWPAYRFWALSGESPVKLYPVHRSFFAMSGRLTGLR